MSEVTSGVSPSSTSGAVYAGEPMTAPSAVSNPPIIRAIPKSVSCGSPYSVRRMFAGLTSRCTVPRRWAVSNAPATFTPMCSASAHPTGPLSWILASNEPCGWYCMTMYGRPVAVVPTWKMVTMCGCPDSLPIATCSRTNRSRLSGSRSAVSTFTATVRSSSGWLQRYTTPNPPRPISSGFSKPAATNSAGTPACTSPCVGSGSLVAIGRLVFARHHGR